MYAVVTTMKKYDYSQTYLCRQTVKIPDNNILTFHGSQYMGPVLIISIYEPQQIRF